MRISDWSSDVCSSDLQSRRSTDRRPEGRRGDRAHRVRLVDSDHADADGERVELRGNPSGRVRRRPSAQRSEERRVGKEWVSQCRSRGSPYHEKNKVEYIKRNIRMNGNTRRKK